MKTKEIDGEQMRELARMISKKIPGAGFTLLVFDFADETSMSNYISNANRNDMIKALNQMIKVLQNHQDFQTPESN